MLTLSSSGGSKLSCDLAINLRMHTTDGITYPRVQRFVYRPEHDGPLRGLRLARDAPTTERVNFRFALFLLFHVINPLHRLTYDKVPMQTPLSPL